MTLAASPTRTPSTAAAARTVDATEVDGSGDTAVRALDRGTARRHARLSAPAFGPPTGQVV